MRFRLFGVILGGALLCQADLCRLFYEKTRQVIEKNLHIQKVPKLADIVLVLYIFKICFKNWVNQLVFKRGATYSLFQAENLNIKGYFRTKHKDTV